MGVLIKLIDAVLLLFFLVVILAAPTFDAQVCFPSKFFPNFLVDLNLWFTSEYGGKPWFNSTCLVYGVSVFTGMIRLSGWIFLAISWALVSLKGATSHRDQPLSRIAIDRAVVALEDQAFVKASPSVLGLRSQNTEWVTLEYSIPTPSIGDWVGVFSPANFSASSCLLENPRTGPPFLCTAPIKYQYANYTNPKYKDNEKRGVKASIDQAKIGLLFCSIFRRIIKSEAGGSVKYNYFCKSKLTSLPAFGTSKDME
ncbi:hypothetical protein CsSME_00019370 [Camellia sinensis var. sinensis]